MLIISIINTIVSFTIGYRWAGHCMQTNMMYTILNAGAESAESQMQSNNRNRIVTAIQPLQ